MNGINALKSNWGFKCFGFNDCCSWFFWRHLQDAGRHATGDSHPGMPWGLNLHLVTTSQFGANLNGNIHAQSLSAHSLTGQPVAKGIEPFCSQGPQRLIVSLCLVWLSSEAPKSGSSGEDGQRSVGTLRFGGWVGKTFELQFAVRHWICIKQDFSCCIWDDGVFIWACHRNRPFGFAGGGHFSYFPSNRYHTEIAKKGWTWQRSSNDLGHRWNSGMQPWLVRTDSSTGLDWILCG